MNYGNPRLIRVLEAMRARKSTTLFAICSVFCVGILLARGAAQQQDNPEEARRLLRHELGNSFLVYRDRIQLELKITSGQKERLDQYLGRMLPEAMQFFHRLDGLSPEEREKELNEYRPKAIMDLAPVLKETLNEDQRTRLNQLVFQREGLFGGGEALTELNVTEEQRRQFMAVIQQTHVEIDNLIDEIHKGAKPDDIRPKVLKKRKDLEGKLEALLTDAQRKQWKKMLGKPIDQTALFDM